MQHQHASPSLNGSLPGKSDLAAVARLLLLTARPKSCIELSKHRRGRAYLSALPDNKLSGQPGSNRTSRFHEGIHGLAEALRYCGDRCPHVSVCDATIGVREEARLGKVAGLQD